MIGKRLGEFVVRPDSLETAFVEDAVSFAEAEVILILWEVGQLLGKVQQGWIRGARWIEGDRRCLGALQCDPGLSLTWARSSISSDSEVERSRADTMGIER